MRGWLIVFTIAGIALGLVVNATTEPQDWTPVEVVPGISVGQYCTLNGVSVMVFEVNTPAAYNINATVLTKKLEKVEAVHESLLKDCNDG